MYLNEFSVRIVGGKEASGGYVEIPHGKQYSIALRNERGVEADAEVSIDGQAIGTFRLLPRGGTTLERKPDDHGRFTFYAAGSDEGKQIGVEAGAADNGLVSVTFTPAKPRPAAQPLVSDWNKHPWTPYPWGVASPHIWCGMPTLDTALGGVSLRSLSASNAAPSFNAVSAAPVASYSEGATGLSGHSDQRFIDVGALDLDESQRTTISLRLVIPAKEDTTPRPLVQRANPVPPPVKAAA